jgi:predicted RNA-binding protein YlqC (UPF0109 family)
MQDNADALFVESVVKAIVDNPDKVEVKRSIDEMGVLLELTVDPSDMGKIIGKEGQTAKALRTLLRVLGAKNNSRVNLKIIEPAGGQKDRAPRPVTEEAPVAEKKPVVEIEEETETLSPMEEEKTTPLE